MAAALQTAAAVAGLAASAVAVPVLLTHNDNYRVVFAEFLDHKALGLCLGLLAVAVGQVGVCLYHAQRCARGDAAKAKTEVQFGRAPEYAFWEGVGTHLSQPEGILLLAGYLVGTWMWDLMQPEYYSLEGGIDWAAVAVQLLLQDALQALMHGVEHSVSSLYIESHKPHHRFLAPRLFDAFNGSLADTLLMIVLPLYLVQGMVPTNCWSYMAFGSTYAAWLTLIHSEWHHPWDPVFRVLGLGTPADHHVHHAVFIKNYGHLFTWWDRLAGTYGHPDAMLNRAAVPRVPKKAA